MLVIGKNNFIITGDWFESNTELKKNHSTSWLTNIESMFVGQYNPLII